MADIGKAYVQIEPTAKGIGKKIEGSIKGEMESAGKSGGSSFGNGFASVIGGVGNAIAGVAKAGAIAVGAATTAAAGFATAAVSSYANYEQLVGGVDKLYGEASGKLQAYADKAFMTSGMSANQYMETATSFSAALIGSLNGDVQKAADMTDLAMRTMSDNVNVFGSDAQSVQNAFQGFAKQNYTMLDNLKLGYGGTKQEMQRLIDDANKWAVENGKAANLSIDSFADVVTAIDYIQQSQNIAGTTMNEAMKTIEGSATATKAAWENVITAIGRGEGLSEAMDGLISAVFGENEGEGLLNQIIPRIQTAMEGIGEFVSKAAPFITDKLPALIEAIVPSLVESGVTLLGAFVEGLMSALPTLTFAAFDIIEMLFNSLLEATNKDGGSTMMEIINFIVGAFEENYMLLMDVGAQILINLLNGIVEGLPELLGYAGEIILHFAEVLIENLPQLIETAAQFIAALAEGIALYLPELIPAIVDIVLTIVDSLIDNLDMLIDAAIELIIALAEGLINALPKLIEKGPIIIEKLVDALIRNIPKLVQAAGELIAALVKGIVDNLPKFLEAAAKIIMELARGILQGHAEAVKAIGDVINKIKEKIQSFDFAKWGKDMLDSFIEGIMSKIDSVKEAAGNVAQAVKDILGFSEPEEGPLSNFHTYAPDMMRLFAQGVEEYTPMLQRQIEKSFDFTMPYQGMEYGVQTINNYEPVNRSAGDENILMDIITMLKEYLPKLDRPTVLDTGALVSATADKYNEAFGKMAMAGAMR